MTANIKNEILGFLNCIIWLSMVINKGWVIERRIIIVLTVGTVSNCTENKFSSLRNFLKTLTSFYLYYPFSELFRY